MPPKPPLPPAKAKAPRVDVTRAASITVVCGSSGSGKSAWVKQQIRDARRVIVWDVDQEYAGRDGFELIRTPQALARRLMTAQAARIAYVPQSLADFDHWAKCAFAWGECIAIAEETADVTTPGKAPDGWGQLVRRGRKRGVRVFAVTQRPAESDKTVIGNASRIHVGRLARANDRAYMARELDLAQSDIDALQPLEWIEKDTQKGAVTRGKLRF